MIPTTEDAYQLLHNGALALARVESNGICIDVPYIHRALKETDDKVKANEEEMETSELMKAWRGRYGPSTNTDSTEQLGTVLFDVLGHTPIGFTPGGQYRTDEDAITLVDDPVLSQFLATKKLKKAIGTNLEGILRETTLDGKLHCHYNLHVATTYRSTSNDPNFQNFPIRNEEIMRLVRQAFIARPGNQIVEVDMSGAEVRTSVCYHRDPTMEASVLDPTKDMHRDMAMECFLLPENEISKAIRHSAKNQFVFPEFYGTWYLNCAKNMWESIIREDLKTKSGRPLRDHLASVGIRELGAVDPKNARNPKPGSFESHLREVERRFWGDRFKVYAQWKKDFYEAYKRKGSFQSLTGFTYRGYMERNDAVNYPIQGSAFHCLLWTLTRIVNVELKRRNMKSLVVGQIHDSAVGDVVPSELDEYLALWEDTMVVQLPKHWPWIIVPMQIDAEVAPVGATWADKKKYKIAS